MNALPTLADEALAELPGLLAGAPDGVAIKAMAACLGASRQQVQAAFRELNDAGRARLVQRGKAFLLLPITDPRLICKVCFREFTRGPKSKRVTCSRRCHAAYGWHDPASVERRVASIRRERQTDKARARAVEINNRRWARPGEREKLSEQNRQRWRDPEYRARTLVRIQAVNGSPDARAKTSETRRAQWQDPEWRRKTTEALIRSKNTPEAKAKFSALLRERWKDPVMRAKYLSPEAIAKRVESTRRTKAAKAATRAAELQP